MLKILLKILTLVTLAVYLVFAIVCWAHPVEDETCCGVDYLIRHTGKVPEKSIVDVAFVAQCMHRAGIDPVGRTLGTIDLQGLKKALEQNAYIDSAFCYYTAAGTLCVGVVPKCPVMQVVTPTKRYFLTDKGSTMPMGQYDLHLPQVTGEVSVRQARRLRPLLQYIRDSRWNDAVEEVRMHPEHGIMLLMRDEPFDVVMGTEEDYEDKLHNLTLFMDKVLTKTARDKYALVNVAYEGQVVGVKRNAKRK